jgi:hypothetical protein
MLHRRPPHRQCATNTITVMQFISRPEKAATYTAGRLEQIIANARGHGIRTLLPVGRDRVPPEKWGPYQTREPTAEEYANWFRRYPDYNAFVITGAINGLFVVDCDTSQAVEYFEKRGHGETWTVRTRRGFHFYFKHPGYRVHNQNRGKIFEHLDIKGDGGYVIAPDSVHPSGFVYTWEPGHSPDDIELAEAPSWLLELLKPAAERPARAPKPFTGNISKYARTAWDRELQRAASAPAGQRNQTLNDSAFSLGQLVSGGELNESDVRESLYAIADRWPNADHSRKTIRNGLEAGMQQPCSRSQSSPSYHATNGNGRVGVGKTKFHEFEGFPEPDEQPGDDSDPAPLPSGLPPVPKLDPQLLPEALRPWLEDVADRAQAPLDFPAVGALTSLSSALGRRQGIRPKRHDDWLVVPNTWGVTVGPPGILKSPMLREVVKPLWRLEAAAREQNEQDLERFELQKAAIEAERARILARAKRSKEKIDEDKLIQELRELRCEPPIAARYLTNDSTIERLCELLNENPHGLLVFRDELKGFLSMMDRSGHEADREFYLEGWNGNGQYTSDRIGRGRTTVKGLCISILGGITPGPLTSYLSEVFSGESDDGLIQRFQLAVYPDIVKNWINVDRYPDTPAKNRAFAIFERFVSFERIVPQGDDDVPWLKFDDPAQDFFDDWRAKLERRIRNSDEHPVIIAHLAKYRSLMPSLALIFHLCDADELCPVTLQAAQRAGAWCDDYLEPHARRIYHCVTARVDAMARLLGDKITIGKLPNPFTARHVYRPQWMGLTNHTDVEAALELLEDLGWVRSQRLGQAPQGGRPTIVYHINPKVLKASKPR